jgi:hypothetical protein
VDAEHEQVILRGAVHIDALVAYLPSRKPAVEAPGQATAGAGPDAHLTPGARDTDCGLEHAALVVLDEVNEEPRAEYDAVGVVGHGGELRGVVLETASRRLGIVRGGDVPRGGEAVEERQRFRTKAPTIALSVP